MAIDLNVVTRLLTEDEMENFRRSLLKTFVHSFYDFEVGQLFLRSVGEIMLGAIIAKEKFYCELGNELGRSYNFGMYLTRAYFLGIGEDWHAANEWKPGDSWWIHEATEFLGGYCPGNEITIGEQVTVILAYGSLARNPKIERIQIHKSGIEFATIHTSLHFADLKLLQDLDVYTRRSMILKYKEFDSKLILKENDRLKVRVTVPDIYGVEKVEDIPFFFGVTFMMSGVARTLDISRIVWV